VPAGVSERETARRRVFTWSLGGATLASSAAVLGLVLAVENTQDKFADCQAQNGQCDAVAEQGKRLELTRNVLIGAAGVFAVATLVSFFVEGRADRSARVSLDVSPSGLSMSRSF